MRGWVMNQSQLSLIDSSWRRIKSSVYAISQSRSTALRPRPIHYNASVYAADKRTTFWSKTKQFRASLPHRAATCRRVMDYVQCSSDNSKGSFSGVIPLTFFWQPACEWQNDHNRHCILCADFTRDMSPHRCALKPLDVCHIRPVWAGCVITQLSKRRPLRGMSCYQRSGEQCRGMLNIMTSCLPLGTRTYRVVPLGQYPFQFSSPLVV